MSWSHTYTERLNGEVVDVTLPDNRTQAWEWYREIQSLATTDPVRWKGAARLAMASDLYVCGLFHTWWQRLDDWTGRPEVDCDFQFEFARWKQFEGDDALDFSSREAGKSTWTLTKFSQEVFRDPDVCAALFSADLKLAERHLTRWGGREGEVVKNEIIKTVWDDVFYADPHNEGAFWSTDKGYIVKRTISSTSPTLSAYTFMVGLPDGSRFGILIFDDVEVDKVVEADDQREKVKRRFHNALQLGGRGCRKWINGTFHHHSGLLADLIKKGWRAKCFPAEDVTQDPPDIAELYDACDGVRPDNGAKIPEAVRQVKLRGMPRYFHPLECAIKRWEQGDEIYERQSMGDASAGQTMRFLPEWVDEELRIKADLREFAQGKLGYILADPSKGKVDPSVSLVLAADADRTLTVVGGFRRKLTPSQWDVEMYSLVCDWQHVLDLRQIRVEIYGQATWDHNLRKFFEARNFNGPPIYGVGTHLGSKADQKVFRAWLRLEPLFRSAKLRLPNRLMVIDERQRVYDLIAYFLEFEYGPFPNPNTDDILDALSLLGEPEDKVPPIEFPDRVVPWAQPDWDGGGEMPDVPGIDGESFLWH